MKWLVWSTSDLLKGMGGVEVHARCVAAELRKRGVEVIFSQDKNAPFEDHWDVIQTHGSQYDLTQRFLKHLSSHPETQWCHTLHGWSIERVIACGEFYWIGGYRAWWRERVGANYARHVFGVHGLINRRHKVSHFSVCGNGWDAAETIDLSQDNGSSTKQDWPSEEKLKSSWLFIGRGNDKVKGAARLAPLSKDLNLIAVPGEGFELLPWVHKTGALSSKNVQRLLLQAKGLVLTSYYEGLPLVVLEALGHGVPVITTAVGGLKSLDKNLKGLYFTDHKLKSLLKIASTVTPYDRASVALHNRKFLRTWSNVTDVIYNKAIGKL